MEQARKAGDSEEHARLQGIVSAVQERCTHSGPRSLKVLEKDSKSGKYRKGGRIEFCLLCGKVTAYETPEQLDAQEREG